MRYDLVFRLFKIFVVVLLAVLPLRIFAQWSTDPFNNLIVGYGLLPELCSDSAGGCYITYEQGTTYPRHLILERLNRYGYKPWGTGKRILGEYSEQSGAKIVEDGQNGVIIAYLDEEETGMYNLATRLRVQRVDSSGNFLWGPNGVRVSLSETNQYDEAIVTDGQQGCIVAWRDTLNELRIQRINYLGIYQWGDSGIVLVKDGSGAPAMISDQKGGSIINWRYQKFQRVNLDGEKVWSDTGITARGGSVRISDGMGGVNLAGMEYISYNNGDPYWRAVCQRIDSSGNVLWGQNGIIIADSIQNVVGLLQAPPFSFAESDLGGITISWSKRVDSSKLSSYLQRIRSDGTLIFTDSTVRVSSIDSSSNSPVKIISSINDSKIILFVDSRSDGSIYIQKIDSLGKRYWTNDVLASDWQIDDLNAITDGNGGIIVVGFGQANFSIQTFQCNLKGIVGTVITNLQDERREKPDKFTLHQNYPNPFNSLTIINYSVPPPAERDLVPNGNRDGQLPIDNFVTIKVYNILGEEVAVLVDGFETAGYKSVTFDGSNRSSGIYFVRMNAGVYSDVKKIMLMK